MVVREQTANVRDPFDEVNEMLDSLELEARRSRELVEQPWQAYL